ncbi:hypothetical protein INT47_003908 [Mucor saturninus]|uniref:Uncharacterized protein n=1 Tax=Mucor saturninus TaxID=64648 RepID=A0A8H7V171_9FUNG|nr:hypothetical protein INT47_003908 [Mucor saturninus]
MVINSKIPEGCVPDVTVYQYLFTEDSKSIDWDKPCFIDAEDDSQTLSYGDFDNLIKRFSTGLQHCFPEFALGDIVAIYSPNELYYPAVVHGIVYAGGAIASFDHSSDVNLAVECLQTVGAKILIAHSETLDRAIEAAAMVGIPRSHIFLLDQNQVDGIKSVHSAMWTHQELAAPRIMTKAELETVPSYFYYTSGTTGKKKAVAITWLHNNKDWHPFETKALSHSELHHGGGLLFTMHTFLKNRYSVFMLKRFTFEKYFIAIEKNKINTISIQPWIAATIAKDDTLLKLHNFSSVRVGYCSGSPTSKSLCQLFLKKLNIVLVNMYGMTETMAPFETDFERSSQGYVGSLGQGFSCKLIDDDGKEVGCNEIGELCLKEPTKKIGYYNNAEANAAAFDEDGFFHTGDLFCVNEHGNFTHIDRINDVIKYRYKKITPQEIEVILMMHPLVVNCAVVGYHCDEQNEWLIRAFVTLKEHDRKIEQVKQEIIDITKENLPDIKQLRGGLFVLDELPKTNTGKINRRALRQYEHAVPAF